MPSPPLSYGDESQTLSRSRAEGPHTNRVHQWNPSSFLGEMADSGAGAAKDRVSLDSTRGKGVLSRGGGLQGQQLNCCHRTWREVSGQAAI